jgi:hypothetical protein
VNDLLSFESKKIRGFRKPFAFHRELPLPLKSLDHVLLNSFISIKLTADFEKGITMMAAVLEAPKGPISALIDLRGTITEQHTNFPK